MRWILNGIAAAGCISLLASCSQPPGTTLKRVPLQPDEFFTTGARQRVITNSDISNFSRPGLVDPQRIVCTEPSPDAAVALANSLGVGLSILGQGAGSISSAQVEGLVQLGERTASIQLLRDKMYNTCLAYSNGAISGTTYSMIMSRLDDVIVTLLLGETAGGAFGRKLAGIGLEASAEASASLSGFSNEMGNLEANIKKLAAANKDVADKEDKLAAAKEEEPPNQQKVTDAENNLKDARAKRDALLQLLQSNVATASKAGGKVAELKTGGGLSARTDPQIARTLEDMQASFLADDYADDYLATCLVELSLQQEDRSPEGRALDILVQAAQSAHLHLTKTPGDVKVQELAKQATDALGEFLTDTSVVDEHHHPKMSPTKQLFEAFFHEWQDEADTSRVDRTDLVAFVNVLTRTEHSSQLAVFCREHLPDFLVTAHAGFEKFRTLREKLKSEVKLGETSARIREAEANRLAEFGRALQTCGTIPAEEQANCRNLVLSGTLPALKAPPEEQPDTN